MKTTCRFHDQRTKGKFPSFLSRIASTGLLGLTVLFMLTGTAWAQTPLPAGKPDTGFDTDGKAVFNVVPGVSPDLNRVYRDKITSLATNVNNEIIAVGEGRKNTTATSSRMVTTLARFNLNTGAPVTMTSNYYDKMYGAKDMVVYGSQIFVAGYWINKTPTGVIYNDPVIALFNTNGTLDTTFGMADPNTSSIAISGQAYLDINDLTFNSQKLLMSNVHAMALDSQNRPYILATAYTETDRQYVVILARFTANGRMLDETFGYMGTKILSWRTRDVGADITIGVDASNNEYIVVTGNSCYDAVQDNTCDVFLMKLSINGGVLNGTLFANPIYTDFGPTAYESAKSVLIQPNGKIVVAARVDGYIGLARYNTNGSADVYNFTVGSGFGPNQSSNKIILTTPTLTDFSKVIVTKTGKFVVAGYKNYTNTKTGESGADFGLVRILSTGSIDQTFGSADFGPHGTGLAKVTFTEGLYRKAYDVIANDNDKLVVGGFVDATSTPGETSQFALSKLWGDTDQPQLNFPTGTGINQTAGKVNFANTYVLTAKNLGPHASSNAVVFTRFLSTSGYTVEQVTACQATCTTRPWERRNLISNVQEYINDVTCTFRTIPKDGAALITYKAKLGTIGTLSINSDYTSYQNHATGSILLKNMSTNFDN